ncbi:hypothetical protein KY358_04745 [Candidatus Woesearchaeota archaeon]|nr:hypothetical protein [Candidatus Woesearchaeota archaeon]
MKDQEKIRIARSKKGQMTIFIIIGILLIIGIGAYSIVRKSRTEAGITSEIESALEEIPSEFSSVAGFISGCLEETLKEGIEKIGDTGGFINPSRHGLVTSDDPTESDAARMDPDSGLSIAYWNYLKSQNSCSGTCSFVLVPENVLYLHKRGGPLSVESQLEDYIEESLDSCLSGFAVLKEQGFDIRELGPISATVSVNDEEVIALADYPLEVSRQGTAEISGFLARSDVNLKKIYELASEISLLQSQYRYLEGHLKNLIVGYSGIKEDLLPPMHETVIKFGGETVWQEAKVKENIENMLASYVQTLKVSNTANYIPYFMGGQLSSALYNLGMLIPVQGEYYDLSTSFIYHPSWWPIYLDMGCEGGACRPESFSSNLLTLIGIQRYSFSYDISFPIQVLIEDPSAFGGQGYSFNFLMESNMRDNQAMPADYLAPPDPSPQASGYCDDDKRDSGNVYITVHDPDDYPIDDADAVYSCGGESCSIGKTEGGSLTAKFPSCFGGGVLSIVKDGYLSRSIKIDIEPDYSADLPFVLNPRSAKRFIVRKRMIEKVQSGNIQYWNVGGIKNLSSNEEAVVLLEKIGSEDEERLQTGGSYNGTQEGPSSMIIAAGKYKATIMVLRDEKITIPASTFEGQYIESQDLPQPDLSGGLYANITFNNYNLENSDTIIFYALSPNLYEIPEEQRTIGDMAKAMDIETLSKKHAGAANLRYE